MTGAPRRRLFGRLGGHDFVLLWAGQTVSGFGTAVTLVALPLLAVLRLHASTFQVGLLSAAGLAAYLVIGLPVGVWVDRLPRRPIIIVCDLVRAVALVSVPVAAAIDRLTYAQLVTVALLVGIGTVFSDIGFQTYLPSVIEPAELLAGNSKLQGSDQVARVAGPAFGGAVVQVVGAPVTILVDVVSYLFDVVCVSAVRKKEPPPEPTETLGMVAKIRQGMRFVVRHPILGPLTIGTANLNMWEAAQEALYVVFLVRTLHTSPGITGVLLAAPGVGGALGAAVTGRLSRRLGSARALLFAVTVGAVAAVLVPLSVGGAGLSLFAVGTAVLAGLTVTFSIIVRSFRQTVSPRHLLGRVTATTKFLTWGVLPIGALIGGALGQALGNRSALWVVSAGLLLTPVIVALTPVRRFRDLPTTPDGGIDEPATVPQGPPQLLGDEVLS